MGEVLGELESGAVPGQTDDTSKIQQVVRADVAASGDALAALGAPQLHALGFMKTIEGQSIHGFRREAERKYDGLTIRDSTFESAHIRRSPEVGAWSGINNVHLERCTHINCSLSTTTLEEVVVDRLGAKGASPLFLWDCAFRQVKLNGRIAGLKLNRSVCVTATKIEQSGWDEALRNFYWRVDWALDISDALFTGGTTFECVPGDKIIRNPEHQILVRRSTLSEKNWQAIDYDRTAIDIALSWFIKGSQFDSVVLAARMGSRYANKDVAVLTRLRNEGIGE